jgi:lipoprotein-anchoring transpeptidase ErfK/SrfK
MPVRMKFSVLSAAYVALAVVSTGAGAQGYRDWDRWEADRRYQPRHEVEPYDARQDRGFDIEPDADADPGGETRRYGDERERLEREDAERQYQRRSRIQRTSPRPRYDADDDEEVDQRSVVRRRPDPRDDQYEDAEDRDDEPSGAQRTAVGADGGPRPVIAPQAPSRVAFSGGYTPGSIVIDTSRRKLYYVTGPTSALAYPIGVGRDGFSWTGTQKVSRIADWPDWYPPAEMRKRKPELPEKMLGGLNNPLGAKAIYLGSTLYRIHGTNDPKSIGRAESSGCFRMLNQHVLHLASLVSVGTQVSVVHSLGKAPAKVAARPAPAARKVAAKPQPVVKKRVTQRTWRPRPYVRRWSERPYYSDYYYDACRCRS